MAAEEPSKILVVDDSPTALEVIERNLSAERYEVVTAPGVDEALRVLESHPVDLVITDLKMPRMDGMELQARLADADPDLTVIIMTGYGNDEIETEAYRRGAFYYFDKPIDLKEDKAVLKIVSGAA